MSLLGVDEALAFILNDVTTLGTEIVPLEDAYGRTLASDLTASLDQPPFPASSMDGYAVRAADIADVPTTLTVVGEAAAGHPHHGPLGPGETVRIFTGAPLPGGANAVVIQENAERDGDRVRIVDAIEVGTYVRPAGCDFLQGNPLLLAGHRLTSRDLMLAAATGETHLRVAFPPRIGILATGDEIVAPGTKRSPGQIFSSVPSGLTPLVNRFGGVGETIGIAEDKSEALASTLACAADYDVLVTIGGASVGDHDLVHRALSELGVDLAFWKIAMRPGKPLMYGRRQVNGRIQHVLGLPGNPVSSMICGRIFLTPLIAALLGQSTQAEQHKTVTLPLAAPLPQNGARRHYMRGRFVDEDGVRKVMAMESQDSSLMQLLAKSDCLIVRRRGARAATADEWVDVLPLDF